MGKNFQTARRERMPDGTPEETVVEEDSAVCAGCPGVELGVAFDDGPVAGDGVAVEEADGVEDAGPEVLE